MEAAGKQGRDSSVELLRILLMLLIMVSHADFKALGEPTLIDCIGNPIESYLAYIIEALSVVAVNSFIFLSGWFGIKPSGRKVFYLLFQVFFLVFLVYLIAFILGWTHPQLGLKDIIKVLSLKRYWFIQGYIILFAFSPILNTFVEIIDKKSYLSILIVIFVTQTLWGWMPFANNSGWYDYGYSPLSFFFIYLLAAYIKKYVDYTVFSPSAYLVGYLLLSAFIALCSLTFSRLSLPRWGGYFYSSPLIVISSCLLCLVFLRISFKSNIINGIAQSALAVYIVHCHECVWPVYLTFIQRYHAIDPTHVFIVKTMVIIMAVFLVSIILDRLRIRIWKGIESYLLPYVNKK